MSEEMAGKFPLLYGLWKESSGLGLFEAAVAKLPIEQSNQFFLEVTKLHGDHTNVAYYIKVACDKLLGAGKIDPEKEYQWLKKINQLP